MSYLSEDPTKQTREEVAEKVDRDRSQKGDNNNNGEEVTTTTRTTTTTTRTTTTEDSPKTSTSSSAFMIFSENSGRIMTPQQHHDNDTSTISTSASTTSRHVKRRKDMFGDCALVEIIHLHDCLRGALHDLQRDVTELSRMVSSASAAAPEEAGASSSSSSASCWNDDTPPKKHARLEGDDGRISSSSSSQTPAKEKMEELELRVTGRFKLIWSVFRAHSAAEDEFIWPALKSKEGYLKSGGNDNNHHHSHDNTNTVHHHQHEHTRRVSDGGVGATIFPTSDEQRHEQPQQGASDADKEEQDVPCVIEQEEYVEDHADEERMFRDMDMLLSQLRTELSEVRSKNVRTNTSAATTLPEDVSVIATAKKVDEVSSRLSKHLMDHLEKEETHCMPLVQKHLTKSEIHDLVGRIMGKRSSQQVGEILSMAFQNLSEADREEMVRYMRQAMVGTFFESWLAMAGWMNPKGPKGPKGKEINKEKGVFMGGVVPRGQVESTLTLTSAPCEGQQSCHTPIMTTRTSATGPSLPPSPPKSCAAPPPAPPMSPTHPLGGVQEESSNNSKTSDKGTKVMEAANRIAGRITTDSELQKLIRAIASNPILAPVQKNATIQKLRDTFWKNKKRKRGESIDEQIIPMPSPGPSAPSSISSSAAVALPSERMTPPSSYWKKNPKTGVIELVYSNTSNNNVNPEVPLFSATELAPTYHDGATATILGCPHYARSCKLLHPTSKRLYTCRLCCEQERDNPMKGHYSPLDRFKVTEVLCMKCGALQPASERCVNPSCCCHQGSKGGTPTRSSSKKRLFAKYHCGICNFYDDANSKPIYHCPFCNVCRSGFGLGIDYRHCMRCNACVSLKDDNHCCIPQSLQGNCPICHELMFESTEPLKGLKCGHVMHLSCFAKYTRGHSYTCPLCKKSVEDMKEYFSLLDAAVRMQPMPPAYSTIMSNIYCQDCGQSGSVQYHFVGCKCRHCGSYNTRELSREQGSIPFVAFGGFGGMGGGSS